MAQPEGPSYIIVIMSGPNIQMFDCDYTLPTIHCLYVSLFCNHVTMQKQTIGLFKSAYSYIRRYLLNLTRVSHALYINYQNVIPSVQSTPHSFHYYNIIVALWCNCRKVLHMYNIVESENNLKKYASFI